MKNHVWKCSYVSKTEVNCDGNKVTINGEIVTWENTAGETGTISQSGINYDTIHWEKHGRYIGLWKKLGLYDMNDTYTFFTKVNYIT